LSDLIINEKWKNNYDDISVHIHTSYEYDICI